MLVTQSNPCPEQVTFMAQFSLLLENSNRYGFSKWSNKIVSFHISNTEKQPAEFLKAIIAAAHDEGFEEAKRKMRFLLKGVTAFIKIPDTTY